MMTYHKSIFSFLTNKKNNSPLIFSGLISVTEAGLEGKGLQFYETHHHAVAAAGIYRVSEFGIDA